MAGDSTTRRRWFGAVALALAVAMLAAGETALRGRLGGVTFVAYWFLCILLTSVAIIIAALDIRSVRGRIRQEHENLLRETVDQIESRAKAASDKPAKTSPTAVQGQ